MPVSWRRLVRKARGTFRLCQDFSSLDFFAQLKLEKRLSGSSVGPAAELSFKKHTELTIPQSKMK
jgi:hypothetical protein